MTFVQSAVLAAVTAAAVSGGARGQTISVVPVFPGGGNSAVYGVNSDGTAVAGYSNNAGGTDTALRWTPSGGSFNMGFLPSGGINSYARAIDGSGTILAGYGDSLGNTRAFRWTTGGGYQVLPVAPGTGTFGTASGISAAGNKVVGTSGAGSLARAFLWDAANPGTSINLGLLPSQSTSGAAAISGDGTVVVGASGNRAFRWTSAGGMVDLGSLPGQVWALGEAVNTNGSVITGRYNPGGNEFGYRWTAATGMVALPQSPGGSSALRPRAVSGDGKVIIGQVVDGVAGFTAFVWTPALGTQLLSAHFASRGVNMTGWQITDATGISADGTAMCGVGIFGGQSVGWVVRGLPCPQYSGWAAGGGVCPGDNLTISALATGPALTYRWFRNGVQLQDGVQPSGSVLSGASTYLVTISPYLPADAGTYSALIASAGACEVASQPIALGPPMTYPVFTQSPANTGACAGNTVVLPSNASHANPLNLRWEKELSFAPGTWIPLSDVGTGFGGMFSGAFTNTLTITNVQPGDSTRYRCRATPTFGQIVCQQISSTVSAAAVLTVVAQNSITQHPQDTYVCLGDNDAFFSVAASPPSDTFTYQWQKKNPIFFNVYNDMFDGPTGNGGNYGGTQTPNLTIAGVYPNDLQYYRCVVTGTCQSIISNDAYLGATPDAFITSGPTATPGCQGLSAAMTITALPPGGNYQWQKYVGPCILCWQDIFNGPTGNGGTYAGAQTPTLTINTFHPFDTLSSYRCIVYGPCGGQPAASPAASFSLLVPPVIQTQPVGGPVCKNGTKTMNVTLAPGSYGAVSYQWWRYVPAFPIFAGVPNGTLPSGAMVSGATSPSITISNFKPQDAGQYYCKVMGDCGDIFSTVVTLTSCPADFNCSGVVTVQDIFDFLAAYFAGNLTADFNNSNTLSVQDLFDFLAAYFAGC